MIQHFSTFQYFAKRLSAAAAISAERWRALFDDGKNHASEHAQFDFSEICIHQVIETIEFVLGSVSHTASYLRLWALSLAHNQLSLVFLDKTLLATMPIGGLTGGIAVYFSTACFLGITFAILMGMDVLECFLHTLRLHWVEFQSKFYKADGSAGVCSILSRWMRTSRLH